MWDSRHAARGDLSTLNDLVRAGKVRYIGASNYSGWQLQKAIDLSRRTAGSPSSACRRSTISSTARPNGSWCRSASARGSACIPWSPLRGGWLAGKYHRGMTRPAAGTRIEIAGEKGLERDLGALRQRADLEGGRRARRHRQGARQGAGPGGAQLAACSGPASPRRSSAPATWRSSTATSAPPAGRSTADDVEAADEVSARPLPYPYETHARLGA